MTRQNNDADVAVLTTKLENITEVLEKISTQTSHIEQRIDGLEQSNYAMRTISGLLAFMFPFVVAVGAYAANLHIKEVINTEVIRILEEKGL